MLVERLLQMVARAILLLAVSCAYAEQYTVTDLGLVDGYAINAKGQVTGEGYPPPADHAFVYTDGQFVDLGTLGGARAAGLSINSLGQVTGFSQLYNPIPINGVIHAFAYSNGQMTDIGTLGGSSSFGYGINGAGQVTGTAELASGFNHAFLYENGTMNDLGTLGGFNSDGFGINANGDVTGRAVILNNSDYHAFLYSNGHMTDLGTLGGGESEGHAINNSDQVTGVSATANAERHAFLYSNGHMSDLGVLPGFSGSEGLSINTNGDVTGGNMPGPGQTVAHAFLYTNGTMFDLNTLIGPATATVTYTLGFGEGINDNGWIVAIGVDSRTGSATHTYLLIPLSYLLASLKGEVISVGPGTSLASKVALAQTSYAANDVSTTCAILTAFGHEVRAQTGKEIDPELATKLISDDATIQAALSCPY